VAHGETVGALTLAFSESVRTYGAADVELAEGLARRAALAIDRARLYRAEQEARVAAERAQEREAFLAETTELLSSTLEFEETVRRIASRAVPRLADWCIVYVVDDSGVIRRLAVEHVHDATRALVEAQLARFALDPATDAAVPKVIRTRELEFHPEASLELLAADVDDPVRFLEVLEVLNPVSWMCLPLVARDESLGAISFFTTDSGRRYEEADLVLAQEVARRAALAVDQARTHRLERQARLAAEDAQVRLTFLAEASSVLSSSLDYETTLEQLAELTVPTLADCCVVDVLHEGRELRQVAVAHVDRRKEGLVRALERRYPTDQADPRSPVGRAMREAETVFLQDLDARLEEIARDEEHLQALRELGLVSGLIVPLVARGQTLGAITLLAAESGRRYTADDVALAQQLASRAALAVDNARLYGASREALRRSAESLARLESLLVTAPIGVAFFDTDLRYALLNEALAQINGLPVEDHIGRRVGEVLPDLDAAPERDLRRVIDTGEPLVGVELAGVTRAHPGEWRHWIVSYYPVVLDGTTVGVGAIFVDITERKRAEEERAALLLREQAARAEAESAGERLTILAEASRILSSSLDYEATIARVARLVADRLADWCVVYLAEDGRIRPLAVAVRDSEQHAAVEAALRRYPPNREGPSALAAAFGAPQSLLFNDIDDDFLRAQAVDGEHYRILSRIGTRSAIVASIVAHDEVVGVVSLASGDAGAQLTAADLALAEELAGRFGLAIDNARLFHAAEARAHSARALATVGDGVVLVDSHGVVRVWNPAAEAITGIPAVEIVGRAAEEAIAGWADVARFVPVGTGPGPGGTRPQTVPLDLRGREAWLSFSAVGFEEGTVYTFRDLTEEHRVEELKTEFVATASHELRTPLAAVYGAAMTLRRPDLELDDERRDILLAVITDESDRLARIVNDILWASRVDSGEVDVRIEPFDAREAARRVVEAAQVHLASDVELRLVAPESFPLVAADEQKVSQVLTNLVENAIKYSPDGGRVEVALEQHDGRVRFAVRDQGLGIPPAEHARIFEKFYRLDPHLTRGVGGTGLGLYICRELVRRMNGRIWVSSREGEGSTFAVELPLAERQLVSTG
jgi:PAS domain S-box-containing protein